MYAQQEQTEQKQKTRGAGFAGFGAQGENQKTPAQGLLEARFFEKQKNKSVACRACNRNCKIAEGAAGFCRVRKNVGGTLRSLVYGKTLTLTIDPIEKKPLFNFRPATQCVGVSTFGCNFACLHCQNWHISQDWTAEALGGVPFTSPEEIVARTLGNGVEGIAYTYNEPTVFAEYALDTMKIARESGLYNVWVSNGYMSREVADAIAPFLDAINIDLKGDARFYREVCGAAEIKHVRENIKLFHKNKVHVEVTNLIVPGYNDKDAQLREVADFVFSVSPEMPLHLSAFCPQWKLDYVPATPAATIARAKEIAEKAGLKYVYVGNLQADINTTRCKKCGSALIRRQGYFTDMVGLKEGGKGNKCAKCGVENNIIV
ncbi:MAG: AmmeMemoRadiSam system radical SAM enzyme [Candidatus Diapherotrites archaeon]